jgi:hypothetical protein
MDHYRRQHLTQTARSSVPWPDSVQHSATKTALNKGARRPEPPDRVGVSLDVLKSRCMKRSPFEQDAEQHVLGGEARITHQKAIIAELERDSHPVVAEWARRILAVMEETLRLARRHLERLREK